MKLTKFINNYYRCQLCYSDEYILKSFKKAKIGWVKCDENEAEIGMAYCNTCNCDQMVPETYFMDKKYKERKRPYKHLFWKKVESGWAGLKDGENFRLYSEIYGRQFKINEFITLKLENDRTSIYVMGELFQQCKFLMLNIPIAELEDYDEIDSIDEAADKLGWTVDGQQDANGEFLSYDISSEEEFWGHCSNLQVWVENNYDTRIMHSNLSFPLLRKLTEVGDPIAKAVFQEEICKRFESYNPDTLKYLLVEKYLQYLTDEQRESLLYGWMKKDIENVFVFLIGNEFLDQFGEQYRSIIVGDLNNHIKTREKAYLEEELGFLFEELDIYSSEDFITQLILKDRFILKEIFDLRQYPIPEESVRSFSCAHLSVLKELKRFLTQLSKNDRILNEVITSQVQELFEIPSVGNMYSLLFFSFYSLLPLDIIKEMMCRENSCFLSNIFNYVGHEVLMKYYDNSMAPYDFLFTYLDDDCRSIFANRVRALPSTRKSKVINGISARMGHKTYHDRVMSLLDDINRPRPSGGTNIIP